VALVLRPAARTLATNRAELAGIVHDLVSELLNQPGIGPVSAAQAIVSRFPDAVAASPPLPNSLAPARSRPPAARPPATAQSGRGPGAKQSHPHHRHHPDTHRPRDPGLPRAPAGRGQKVTVRSAAASLGNYLGLRLEDRVVIPSVVPGDGPVAVPLRWPV